MNTPCASAPPAQWLSQQVSQRGTHRPRAPTAVPPVVAPCSTHTRRRTVCSASSPRGGDPVLVSLGVDDASTGGTVVTQAALAEAFAHAVAAGRVECDPATLGATLKEQVAAGRRILLASGVHTRGSQRPADSYFVRTPGLPSLAAEPLLERFHLAASRALHRWTQLGGAGAAGVTHLVVGSTTPPRSAPGPDIALMTRLGLPNTVRRVPCHHLGDHGGLRALALAVQIARGDPRARVLVVYGDIMSTLGAFMPTPLTADDLRSIAVFTDGAAAAVVAGAQCEDVSRPLATVLACRSALLPRGQTHSGTGGPHQGEGPSLRGRYNEASAGMSLEMRVPQDWGQQTEAAIRPFVEQLLADAHLAPGDLHSSCLVALHPSGEGLLDGSAAALGLELRHAAASRAVLGTRGNPSGAGTLMALGLGIEAAAAAGGAPGGPSHAVAVALGPGPSAEGLVLRL